jgi:hypothetical protein
MRMGKNETYRLKINWHFIEGIKLSFALDGDMSDIGQVLSHSKSDRK